MELQKVCMRCSKLPYESLQCLENRNILRGAQKPQTEQKENVQLVTKSQAATAKNTKI